MQAKGKEIILKKKRRGGLKRKWKTEIQENKYNILIIETTFRSVNSNHKGIKWLLSEARVLSWTFQFRRQHRKKVQQRDHKEYKTKKNLQKIKAQKRLPLSRSKAEGISAPHCPYSRGRDQARTQRLEITASHMDTTGTSNEIFYLSDHGKCG